MDDFEFECIGVCAPADASGECAGCGRPMTPEAEERLRQRKAAAAGQTPEPAAPTAGKPSESCN